jgi:hypothetical protein
VLTETEQEILFKVVTGDDISAEEGAIIEKSPLIGHSDGERVLQRKILSGEDFTRDDVRAARDLIRGRHIVRDLETIRKNVERKVWSERSRRIRLKNICAYQFRTKRIVERRNEPGRLDFRGSGLFFRLVGTVHGIARVAAAHKDTRGRNRIPPTYAARVVEIRNRRELFGLTPNRDLVPALIHAMMLCCESVDIAQCMYKDGRTTIKVATMSVDKYHNLLEVVKARLFQVVALIKEFREDHDLRARFLHLDPLEKNILLHKRMKGTIEQELKRTFRPEFLNRVDHTVIFKALSKVDVREIVDLQLKDLAKRVADKDVTLKFTPGLKQLLVEKGYDVNNGARPMRRAVQTLVEDKLAEALLDARIVEGDTVMIKAVKGEVVLEVANRISAPT